MDGIKGRKDNSNRKFTGSGPRPDLKEFKRDEAEIRVMAWQRLTPKEQLAVLDRRLGPGVGATKERAKIAARMAGSVQKSQKGSTGTLPVAATVQGPTGPEKVKAKDRRAQERRESGQR